MAGEEIVLTDDFLKQLEAELEAEPSNGPEGGVVPDFTAPSAPDIPALREQLAVLKETCRCHQRKNGLCKAIDILFKACWGKRKNTPLPCPSSLSLPTRRAWRRCKKSHRSNLVFESLQHWKIFYQTASARSLLFARRSRARLRAWRTAGCPSKHTITTRANLKVQHLSV